MKFLVIVMCVLATEAAGAQDGSDKCTYVEEKVNLDSGSDYESDWIAFGRGVYWVWKATQEDCIKFCQETDACKFWVYRSKEYRKMGGTLANKCSLRRRYGEKVKTTMALNSGARNICKAPTVPPTVTGTCIYRDQEYKWNVGGSYIAETPLKCYEYCHKESTKKSSTSHPTAWIFVSSRGKKGGKVGKGGKGKDGKVKNAGIYKNCYCQRHAGNEARKAVTGGRKTVGGDIEAAEKSDCKSNIGALPKTLK